MEVRWSVGGTDPRAVHVTRIKVVGAAGLALVRYIDINPFYI